MLNFPELWVALHVKDYFENLKLAFKYILKSPALGDTYRPWSVYKMLMCPLCMYLHMQYVLTTHT